MTPTKAGPNCPAKLSVKETLLKARLPVFSITKVNGTSNTPGIPAIGIGVPPAFATPISPISSDPSRGLAGVNPWSGITNPVTGSIVPPLGPKHSVKLSTPPPSQSKLAIGLAGFAARNSHKSKPESAKASQLSSGPKKGSPPASHSSKLLTPPPSQSAVAIGLIGLANINAQWSISASAKLSQLSSNELSGSPPAIHSSILLSPPPSQSIVANGLVGLSAK